MTVTLRRCTTTAGFMCPCGCKQKPWLHNPHLIKRHRRTA